jgi:hypothetical protein
MRPFLLIAINVAKQQMWPLFFLLLWVLGWIAFGMFADSHGAADDALMIFRQLGMYAVAFAVFFGSSAIPADLRSRRILAVLSKAVSRFQYLAGVLAGIGMILGAFCLCTGFTASWLLGRFGYNREALWFGIFALFTACLLTAALTLVLSTFLPPLFAAIGSAMLAGIPALLTMQGNTIARYVIPVYGLLEPVMGAEFNTAWQGNMGMVPLGLAESAILLLMATWIFARRDLAVAVE